MRRLGGAPMTQAPPITSWPVATRSRVAKAIIDAALPTCGYLFEHPDGAWRVEPISELPQQYIEPPRDAVLDFLVERLSPALALLKMIYGIEAPEPSNGPAARKPSKPPTLASVSKDARKAGIDPTRIEIKPDGSYVVDIGKGEQQQANAVDEW